MKPEAFQKRVWEYYRAHGRHDLPWRKTSDPYRILVSEVMLQQTQVERVRPYYRSFIRQFPSARSLANASLASVLEAWQGLGYNRRAKYLHAAAKEIAQNGFPKGAAALQQLPGVGPYTARAVAAFAYNEDGIVLETNIRTTITHHFFSQSRTAYRSKKIPDTAIEKVLLKVFVPGKSREWNLALMDYGAFLKASGISLNARSAHYAAQKPFAGSMRQARGAILKELAKRASADTRRLTGLLGEDRTAQLASALAALAKEGLIRKRGTTYVLPR